MSTRRKNWAGTLLVLASVLVSHSIAATAQTGSASAQKVNVDFDHQADFARCATYSWIIGQPARNAYVDNWIVSKIDDALASKGWRKSVTEGSCLVMYQASIKENKPAQVMGGSWGSGWGVNPAPVNVRVNRVLEGMLIVDIGYAENRQIIWRGVATDTIGDSDDKNEKALTSIVETMFKDFPPSPGSPRIP
jgi:uncharacterized protein DUF4136